MASTLRPASSAARALPSDRPAPRVDPHMPFERLSCPERPEFGAESSLPLGTVARWRRIRRISREIGHAEITNYYSISITYVLAVLAVFGERLSGSNSLLSGKIQGNFADLTAKTGRRLDFPTISQLVTPKFPTHLNREFSGTNRECFPHSRESRVAKSPADGIFGKDRRNVVGQGSVH